MGKTLKIRSQESITPLKAQLLGFLAGDGCIATCRGRAINTDPSLLKWIEGAVEEIYGVSPSSTTNFREHRLPITEAFLCKRIVEDLHSIGAWGIHRWRVPNLVRSSSANIRAAFTRGFFDAEGNVFVSEGIGSAGKHHHHVSATSANKQGLAGIRSLLESLKIGTGFYAFHQTVGGEEREYYKVQVHRREYVVRFAQLIGFESKGKRSTLEAVLSLPKVKKKGDVFEERLALIREHGLENYSAPAVAQKLGCSQKQVWDARKWERTRKRPVEATGRFADDQA